MTTKQCVEAITQGDHGRLRELLQIQVERTQDEDVVIAAQAWRYDRGSGSENEMLREVFHSVSDGCQPTLDNASMLLVLSALKIDDEELLATAWAWNPAFEIRLVPSISSRGGGRVVNTKTMHDGLMDVFRKFNAERCVAWYRINRART